MAGWINKNVSPIPQAMAAAAVRSEGGLAMTDPAQMEVLLAQKPELQKLLPRLVKLPPETLAALDILLANPERGSEILAAISQIDAEVIAALHQIGAKDRNLLLALIKGI